MTEASEDVLRFVLLLEEHHDVLLKSQTSVNKKKKEDAATIIISKWTDISKTQLSHVSLCKKINNLKARAKLALKNGKTNEWQAKLLKLIPNNMDENEDIQMDFVGANGTDLVPTTQKVTAEQVLSEHETEQTKLLSNEQLQRYVLLQQVQVLELQRKRLEHLNAVENGKTVEFDLIGFEEEIEGTSSTTPKF